MLRQKKQGIILIFVLMVLATFTLLALGLSFRVRIENKLSKQLSAEYENFYLINSKLNQIMLLISYDDNEYDSFKEDWAKGQNIELEKGGNLKIAIEDEDGKLDINNATDMWLDNLFLSELLKEEIIAKRPFFVIEEILMLEALKNDDLLSINKEDIFSLITTEENDKMNINTIREDVFYSMPGVSRAAVDAVLSTRKNQPIDNLEILKDVGGISLDELQTFNKILKTTSNFYTVKIKLQDEKNKINKSYRITLRKGGGGSAVEITRWLEQ